MYIVCVQQRSPDVRIGDGPDQFQGWLGIGFILPECRTVSSWVLLLSPDASINVTCRVNLDIHRFTVSNFIAPAAVRNRLS